MNIIVDNGNVVVGNIYGRKYRVEDKDDELVSANSKLGLLSGAMGFAAAIPAALFIMIGAEFVGMILLIVYVGAVAVLFLFVVMEMACVMKQQKIYV